MTHSTTRFDTDLETIAAVGYEDEDAVCELVRRRPELHMVLALETYRSGDVSCNRVAELAGTSTEVFQTSDSSHWKSVLVTRPWSETKPA